MLWWAVVLSTSIERATLPEVLHVVLSPFMEMVAYTLKYTMNTSCISLPNTPYITISYHTTYPHCACKFCYVQKKNKFYRRRKKCSQYFIVSLFYLKLWHSFCFYSTIFYNCSLEMAKPMTMIVIVIIYTITYRSTHNNRLDIVIPDETTKEAFLIDVTISNSHNLHCNITEKLHSIQTWKNSLQEYGNCIWSIYTHNRYYSKQITWNFKTA